MALISRALLPRIEFKRFPSLLLCHPWEEVYCDTFALWFSKPLLYAIPPSSPHCPRQPPLPCPRTPHPTYNPSLGSVPWLFSFPLFCFFPVSVHFPDMFCRRAHNWKSRPPTLPFFFTADTFLHFVQSPPKTFFSSFFPLFSFQPLLKGGRGPPVFL